MLKLLRPASCDISDLQEKVKLGKSLQLRLYADDTCQVEYRVQFSYALATKPIAYSIGRMVEFACHLWVKIQLGEMHRSRNIVGRNERIQGGQ